MKIKRTTFLFFKFLPFANFDLKIYNQDNSKSIIARNFKLGQLIEVDKKIIW